MIEQMDKAALAVASLRRELAEFAAMQNSESAPEDLVMNGDRFMANIEPALKSLLSAVSDRSHLDMDSMRNLVFGGDSVSVSFYGPLGAGCLMIRPDKEDPVELEDWSGTRVLTRFWSFIESMVQPEDLDSQLVFE